MTNFNTLCVIEIRPQHFKTFRDLAKHVAFTVEGRPTEPIVEFACAATLNVALDTLLLGGVPDPITIFDGDHDDHKPDEEPPGVTSHTPAFVQQDLGPFDDAPQHTATGVASGIVMASRGLQISLLKPGGAEVIGLPATPADVKTSHTAVVPGAARLDVVVVEIGLVLGHVLSDEIKLPGLDLLLIHVLLDLLSAWAPSPGFVAEHRRSNGEGVHGLGHRVGDRTTRKGFHLLWCGGLRCLRDGFSSLGGLLASLLGASQYRPAQHFARKSRERR